MPIEAQRARRSSLAKYVVASAGLAVGDGYLCRNEPLSIDGVLPEEARGLARRTLARGSGCEGGQQDFAFLGSADSGSPTVTMKCGRDAEEAGELRNQYPDAVTVSRYIGHRGWNSVRLDGTVPADELKELVDASYEAIVKGAPEKPPALISSGVRR